MDFYIPDELVNYISLFCGNRLEFRCLCQEYDHLICSRLNSLTITNEKGLIKNCGRLRTLTIKKKIDSRLLELFLSEGNIEDLFYSEFTGSVSIFQDIKKLNLRGCKGLTDFEFLSKVEELNLSNTNFTGSTFLLLSHHFFFFFLLSFQFGSSVCRFSFFLFFGFGTRLFLYFCHCRNVAITFKIAGIALCFRNPTLVMVIA